MCAEQQMGVTCSRYSRSGDTTLKQWRSPSSSAPALMVLVSRFTVFCLVFCLSTLSYTQQMQSMCQMTQLVSEAQQVHCIVPCLLLTHHVLYTPDAESVR